jgi:YD repeat-containing protein
MKRTLLAALALMAVTTVALAQQQTFYDNTGRVVGRSTTDSAGSTTFYDAADRVTGRASTSGNGTTTYYDANGRNLGNVRTPPLLVPRR